MNRGLVGRVLVMYGRTVWCQRNEENRAPLAGDHGGRHGVPTQPLERVVLFVGFCTIA